MAFMIMVILFVAFIGAYYLAPVIERFGKNYVKGVSSSKKKKGEKKDGMG